MDHLRRATCPESLKATLNCYQLSSVDSLSGPSGFPAQAAQMWFKENKQLPPVPPQPMVPVPYLIPNDKSAVRSETTLCNETITCFIVGGEKRLCLPQILNSVLRDFSIADINQACAELHIYCSRCSPDQLEILKVLGILPINTAQCGLITKSDAERLVGALCEEPPTPNSNYADDLTKTLEGLPVCHECFGFCEGLMYPELYTSPSAPCIKCKECKGLFITKKFIMHTHRGFEKRTCHWGFDPDNWRSYLILPMEMSQGKQRTESEKLISSIKARFELQPVNYLSSPTQATKRRYESELETPHSKKIKEESLVDTSAIPRALAGLPYGLPSAVRQSAFRPWSPCLPMVSQLDMPVIQSLAHIKGAHGIPFAFDRAVFPQFLQTGAPVILQPSTDAERLTSNTKTTSQAVPNVYLAPSNGIKSTSSHKEKESRDRHLEIERQRNLPPPLHSRKPSIPPPKLISPPTNVSNEKGLLSPRSIKSPNDPPRPISRSREAAAAMLELKSAGIFRNKAKSSPTKLSNSLNVSTTSIPQTRDQQLKSPPHSNVETVAQTTPPRSSTSMVVPLDHSRNHYKWTINGNTYMISSSGVKELESLQNLIEQCANSEQVQQHLMHELVRMKAFYEERLDIKTRVMKDLEMELDHVKNLKKQQLQEMADDRKKMRDDIEVMRQKYTKRIDELVSERQTLKNRTESSLKNTVKQENKDMCQWLEKDSEKKIEELRSSMRDLESANDSLRLALHDEREKRRSCEMKLEESGEKSRGRLAFLMESNKIMQSSGTKRSAEDLNNNFNHKSNHELYKGSANNYITMLTDASKATEKKRKTSLEDDEIIVE